jgi:hypothetical protein
MLQVGGSASHITRLPGLLERLLKKCQGACNADSGNQRPDMHGGFSAMDHLKPMKAGLFIRLTFDAQTLRIVTHHSLHLSYSSGASILGFLSCIESVTKA